MVFAHSILTSILLSLLLTVSAKAEILLVDDFTVPLDFDTVTITGDTGYSGRVGDFLWLEQGASATWQDTDSNILGGTRSGKIVSASTDAGSTLDWVQLAINPQNRLDVASGTSSRVELLELTYDVSSADLTIMNWLWADIASMDSAADGNVCVSLTLSDGVIFAKKILGFCSETAGADRLWFSDMPELTSGALKREDITTATIEFTSTVNASDFRVNSVYFTVNNPEPAPIAFLVVGFACVAFFRTRIQRRKVTPTA